jgi:phosphoglycolate phosphatase-like HAD superfamily hydrolase
VNLKRFTGFLAALVLAACAGSSAAPLGDPLPSWNDGAAKSAIVEFVRKAADIPVEDRVAVFDNDGTLWSEQPMYVQFVFVADRIRELAPRHPEWKELEPYKAVLEGQLGAALAQGEQALVELLQAAQGGMSGDEFERIVIDWITKARHPKFQRPYSDLVYQPMLEVLAYLRANEFKTFIVSGGDMDFMRPWVEKAYGIPPEQVVGSTTKVKFETKAGAPSIQRSGMLDFVNDGPGKPAGIYRHIGRRPIAAFGNSDGDLQMLQWTTSGNGLTFGLIVRHTDAAREWAYDRESHVGKLDEALDEAPKRGWVVVDMRADWKRIYPFGP